MRIKKLSIYFSKFITAMDREDARRLFLLSLPSLIVSFFICLIWYLLRDFLKIPLSEGNTADSWSSNLGFVYAAVVALVLGMVSQQHEDFQNARKDADKKMFLRLRDKRIPRPIKMILGVLSFMLVWQSFLIPHENIFYGVNQLFSVTFGAGLIIQIARELDDPYNGIWRVTIKDLPKEWQDDPEMIAGCPLE